MIKNLIMDGNGLVYDNKLLSNGAKKKVLRLGVKTALRRLSNDYNLFLMSDSNRTVESKKNELERLGVLCFFKEVTHSRVLKFSKKETPKSFEKAVKLWGLNKNETLFIGHDAREVFNAGKAGLAVIKTSSLPLVNKSLINKQPVPGKSPGFLRSIVNFFKKIIK